MKAVMLSIQPKWCEVIASGKKTVEVRKTRPNIKTPFKCYIYCTKSNKDFLQSRNNVLFYCEDRDFIGGHGVGLYKRLNGKVIGEFVCDEIIVAECGSYFKISLKDAQLDALDLMEYADGKTVYGWHISELVIYNEPNELHHFFKPCGNCDKKGTRRCTEELTDCRAKVIERPPQSWCYVDHPTEKGGAEE